MDNYNKIQSRKKFIFLGISAAALFTVFRIFIPGKKKKAATIKMLTQDGHLVEVDEALMKSTGKKVDNKEIHTWVKNKQKPTTYN